MNYTNKEYDQLKAILKIDRDYIDEDCLNQSSNFFHACEGFALAVAERDEFKRILELTEAELDKTIRSRPLAEDDKKPTEPQIKGEIIRNEKYQAAYENYIDACLNANKWKSLKAGFEDRRSMLETLQRLYSSGYGFGKDIDPAIKDAAATRIKDKYKRE